MFPRYQIGDIIRATGKRNNWEEHYLILDIKWPARQDNIADMYLALCLDNGLICDQLLQETIHCKIDKVG